MEWMYFWSKFAMLLSDYPLLQRKAYLYKDYSLGHFQWKLMREGRTTLHFKRGEICEVFPVEIVVVRNMRACYRESALYSLVLAKEAFYAEISVRSKTHTPSFPLELSMQRMRSH